MLRGRGTDGRAFARRGSDVARAAPRMPLVRGAVLARALGAGRGVRAVGGLLEASGAPRGARDGLRRTARAARAIVSSSESAWSLLPSASGGRRPRRRLRRWSLCVITRPSAGRGGRSAALGSRRSGLCDGGRRDCGSSTTGEDGSRAGTCRGLVGAVCALHAQRGLELEGDNAVRGRGRDLGRAPPWSLGYPPTGSWPRVPYRGERREGRRVRGRGGGKEINYAYVEKGK